MVGFPQADKSAVAAINRALQACDARLRYPDYFVKVHNRLPVPQTWFLRFPGELANAPLN